MDYCGCDGRLDVVKRAVWLFAAFLFSLAACRSSVEPDSSPPIERLQAVMAALQIPPGWDLISQEVVVGPCLDPVERCPEVSRVYEVENRSGFQEELLAMLDAAGMGPGPFHIENCDPPKDGCRVGGFMGNVSVTAVVTDMEDDVLTVLIYAA